MKRILLFAAFVVCLSSAMAQSKQGTFSVIPKVGMTWAKLTDFDWAAKLTKGTQYYSSSLDKARLKAGVLAGAEVEYQITDAFSATLGGYYSLQGMYVPDYLVENPVGVTGVEDMHLDMHYLNIPVMLKYYVFKGFAVQTGVQAGVLLSNKMKNESTRFEKNEDDVMTAVSSQKVDEEWDNLRSFDFAIPVGISYEYEHVVLDVRYNIGLSKVFKDGSFSSRNSVIDLSVGYKFDL